MPNFAGVPYVAQEEEKKTEAKDKDIEEVQQKTNELNFLDELKTRPIVEEQNTQQQVQTPQYQAPNYVQFYDQISQFTESPVAQQGGQQMSQNEINFLSEIAIKDNNGYWNKNNHGKVVEINSPNITMKNVNQDLIGISKETKEKKLMKKGKDYFFKNTKNVIEIPLKNDR